MDEAKFRKLNNAITYSLCGILLIVFGWIYCRWMKQSVDIKHTEFAELLSSGLSCILFYSVSVIAVSKVVTDVLGFFTKKELPAGESEDNPAKTSRKKDIIIVFFAILVLSALIVTLGVIIRHYMVDETEKIGDSIRRLWSSLDSQHYIHIAEKWYAATGDLADDVRVVFFPGYPILVGLLGRITIDYFAAGMFLSAIFFALAGVYLWLVVEKDYGREIAHRAVRFLCCTVGVFFFAAPMTESLFLFTTLAAVYYIREKKYLKAAVFGAYSAFTRSAGVFIMIIFFYELLMDFHERRGEKKDLKKYAGRLGSMFIIPTGLLAYLLINFKVTGDAFKFMYYQEHHWGQKLGYFFNTAKYMVEQLRNNIKSGDVDTARGLWMMGLFALFATLIIMLMGSKKIRTSYVIYSLVYFAFSMGATWLLSAPRYAAGLFTIPISLALLPKRKWGEIPFEMIMTVINVFYMIMFVLRWQVW